MPPPDPAQLGPLVTLVGTWEGDGGSSTADENGHPDRNVLRRVE